MYELEAVCYEIMNAFRLPALASTLLGLYNRLVVYQSNDRGSVLVIGN